MELVACFDIHPRHLSNDPEDAVVRVRDDH